MTIAEIKRVCFVGAGTMGCYNSLITALAGYRVILYDISDAVLERVPQVQLDYYGPALIDRGVADRKAIEAASAGIVRTADPEEAARDADLLSESVFERLDLKRRVHQQFERLLPAHALMTTNTSTILLSKIESAVRRGDRFAAMHFHQPTPLVDVVAGPRTSAATIEIVQRFVRSQGQIAVMLKKEREGYLHNAMFSSLLGTAMMLAAMFGIDLKKIDQAWMLSQKDVAGPFGMMDHVGLNVVADALGENANREVPASPEVIAAVSDFLRPYLTTGHLGVKTGRGFYEYPEAEFLKPEFLAGVTEDAMLSGPLVNSVLSTALTLAAEGFADPQDIDKSWMLTHNPECGPFGAIDAIGLDTVKKDLHKSAEHIEALMGHPGTAAQQAKTAADFLDTLIQRGQLGVKTGRGFYSYPDPDFRKPGFLGTSRI